MKKFLDFESRICNTIKFVQSKRSIWGNIKKDSILKIQGKHVVRVIYKDKKIIVMENVITGRKHSYNLNDFITNEFKYKKLGGINNG